MKQGGDKPSFHWHLERQAPRQRNYSLCSRIDKKTTLLPKKLRRREPDEDPNPTKLKRSHTKYTCGNCHQTGHNTRKCPTRPVVEEPEPNTQQQSSAATPVNPGDGTQGTNDQASQNPEPQKKQLKGKASTSTSQNAKGATGKGQASTKAKKGKDPAPTKAKKGKGPANNPSTSTAADNLPPEPLNSAPTACNPALAPVNPCPEPVNPSPAPVNPSPAHVNPSPAHVNPPPALVNPHPVAVNPTPTSNTQQPD
ncbi:Zinc finger, CCHC-type [Sesbania bispinosa]|nr:Zinc finger, CCHC-type [Sesbania bispinosa]